jgi:hypothetical protein
VEGDAARAGLMETGADTLGAVVIGAVLATVGGFAATRLEVFFSRRERERGAALLFGEILTVIELITSLAVDARGRGEPYGALTMRFLRAVQRETEAYDRNRESLYDLRNAKIRAQIHALMVRVTLTLEGIFDATAEIALAAAAVKALAEDDLAKADAVTRLADLNETRDSAFDFLVEIVAETLLIVAALKPLAKQTFEAFASVVERP